jgi:hypothetical protein
MRSAADLNEIDEIKKYIDIYQRLALKCFLPQHTTSAGLSIGTLNSVRCVRYLSNALYLQKLKELKIKISQIMLPG